MPSSGPGSESPGARGRLTRNDEGVLVWVTGVSGCGKSTVCEALRATGRLAVDADWDGFNHWVHRDRGERVVDPSFPVPPGWMNEHAWCIDRRSVAALAAEAGEQTAFLFGVVENDADVWDLFDHVVCLVIDEETLRYRLATRTTNAFGKEPDELQVVLAWNRDVEARYRSSGASIVDANQPIELVVRDLLVLVDGWTS
jgi:thymidylate kinase